MRFGAALLGAALFFGASSAGAALTSSERGQIRDFVARARVENAHKVRSLVARTDLSREESVAALSESVAPVAFGAARGAFLREVVFGGASAPSRPILTLAAVKATLARADAVYDHYVGGLDHEPRAIDELVAIYGWLDATIANAGTPSAAQHDASAGIPAATYAECSKALSAHIDRNARWLKGDGAIPPGTSRLRAQAQLALVDMLPEGLTRRVDAADRLALKGARRATLADWGVLFADAGTFAEAKVERVRQLLVRLPGAREDLSAVYVGAGRGGALRARGAVAYVSPAIERHPLEEVAPPAYDPAVSAIAHDLAVLVASRVLRARPELRVQAERDVAASSGDSNRLLGRPRAPSVEHVIGGAIHALLVDAPRAIEVAAARLVEGRPETAALLSDALGVLAASAPAGGADAAEAPKLELGKGDGDVSASAVRVAPNGTVVGLSLDGHTWAIERAASSYAVMGVRRDGAVLTPATAKH